MKVSGFTMFLKTESGIRDYSESKNEHFSFSISEQKDGDISIIKGRLTAHAEIEPVWLDVEIPAELGGLSFYANGFQSWSESPLINKSTKIKKLWGLPAALFRLRNFGDYNFSSQASESGNAYSHLYIDLMNGEKTDTFMGDLLPYDSYTMFSADYKNNGKSGYGHPVRNSSLLLSGIHT